MEAHDILAGDVQIGRPVTLEFVAFDIGIAGGRDVVRERIHPDIHHMRWSARHLDAPVERRSRDRKVLQAAFDKTRNFVEPLARQHEVGHIRIEGEQFVLIGRQAEEIGFLLGPLDRRAQRFAADTVSPDGGFRFVEISLLADRIPACIFAEIDIAVLLDRTARVLGTPARGAARWCGCNRHMRC